MSQMTSRTQSVAPEDSDRAVLYGFIGRMLQAAPTADDLKTIAAIDNDGSEIGQALGEVAATAGGADSVALAREYQDLFIGVGRGELVPYGSYYLTGFLHEKPLAELRQSMAGFGIERAEGVSEPEDHIAALMQMMEGLILGDFGSSASLEDQKRFFEAHVASWAPHFFKDLAATGSSRFYAAIGRLGASFIAIEQDAFAMGG